MSFNKPIQTPTAYSVPIVDADPDYVIDENGNLIPVSSSLHITMPAFVKKACGRFYLDSSSYAVNSVAARIPNYQWRQLNSYGVSANYGIDASSFLWSWGSDNSNGSLGNGTTTASMSPVSVLGGRLVTQVETTGYSGPDTCCFLDSSSYAWTFGYNGNGQLGDGTVLHKSSPVSVIGDRQFIKLGYGRGGYWFFGIDSSSYAWAWGSNGLGNLGDGTTLARSSPVSVQGGPWDSIYSFGQGTTTIGISKDAYYIWGNSTSDGGGFINTSNNILVPTRVNYPFRSVQNITKRGARIVVNDISSVFWHWGTIGNPLISKFGTTGNYAYTSLPITGIKKLIFAGSNGFSGIRAALLDTSSNIWMWGVDNYGQLGVDNYRSSYVSIPQRVPGKFVDICVGSGLSCALDESGFAWTWGTNVFGGLGRNSVQASYSPISVVGAIRWKKVFINNYGVLGLDISSKVWAWGSNSSGQIGDGTTVNKSSPVSVAGGRLALDIVASGAAASYLLDESSFIWGWGNNSNGQLGDNTLTSRSSPVSVVGGRRFKSMQGTQNSFYAIDESDYVWSCGSGFSGALGDNTTIAKSSLVSVVGAVKFSKLFNYVYANTTDSPAMGGYDFSSNMWAWGFSSKLYGFYNQSSPVSIGRSIPNYTYNETYGFGIGTGRTFYMDAGGNAGGLFPSYVSISNYEVPNFIEKIMDTRRNILGR